MDATALNSIVITSMGTPIEGNIDSVAIWRFSKLPSDFLEISFTPKISRLAETFISIGPNILTLFFALLTVFLHFVFMKKYRMIKPSIKFSWVAIVGSIVVPFIILFFFSIIHNLISLLIGDDAGRYGTYSFMVIFFYPLFLPVYWLIMWLIDRRFKKKFSRVI